MALVDSESAAKFFDRIFRAILRFRILLPEYEQNLVATVPA